MALQFGRGYNVYVPPTLPGFAVEPPWYEKVIREAAKQIPRVIQINYPSKPQGSPPIMPAPFPPPWTQSKLPTIGKDPYGGLREAPKKPGNMMPLLLVGVAAMFLIGRK